MDDVHSFCTAQILPNCCSNSCHPCGPVRMITDQVALQILRGLLHCVAKLQQTTSEGAGISGSHDTSESEDIRGHIAEYMRIH